MYHSRANFKYSHNTTEVGELVDDPSIGGPWSSKINTCGAGGTSDRGRVDHVVCRVITRAAGYEYEGGGREFSEITSNDE